MNYKIHRLSNGLRVQIVPMPSLESVTTIVWVKTGSRMEPKKINGISHFLEHMVFKGSSKRPSAKAISEVVDSIGGEFNAATSKDWTNFYIKSGVNNLETAIDILSDMVLKPVLDKKEIEREKGTIIQELAMYEDNPMIKINDVFEELIFSGNSLSWDIGGDEKSVKGIAKSDFESYRKIHYYPENMLITIAGGVDEKKALQLTKKYFGSFNSKGKKQNFEKFKDVSKSPKIKLKNKKNEQAHLILGFISDGREYKNRYAQAVLSAVLGGGMSSRMFIEVRERRGLAYAVRTGIERYDDVGYISTYAGVDPKNALEAVKIILREYYKVAEGDSITQKELNKAKEYIKGHLALALEDTRDVASFFGEQELFVNDVKKPEDVFREIDKVTLKDVYDEAKRLFKKENLNLALIGSFKDEKKFIELLK